MREGASALLTLALGLATGIPAAAHENQSETLPPEPERLYELPAPGSYELPVIDRVAEHLLLDSRGERVPLLGLGQGQVAFVSFVYSSCAQASGCPLALAVLQRFDRELARRPGLMGRVRLVTVSFDPQHDGPQKMAELRRHLAPRGDWRFLTATSQAEIAPVLEDYGQDVRWLARGDEDVPLARHVLRVFLVDAQRAVRNVYSAGFLDAGLLRNDAATALGVADASPEPRRAEP